jgi:hypothetical protein
MPLSWRRNAPLPPYLDHADRLFMASPKIVRRSAVGSDRLCSNTLPGISTESAEGTDMRRRCVAALQVDDVLSDWSAAFGQFEAGALARDRQDASRNLELGPHAGPRVPSSEVSGSRTSLSRCDSR